MEKVAHPYEIEKLKIEIDPKKNINNGCRKYPCPRLVILPE